MSDHIIRAITADGSVKAVAITGRDLVERARTIHTLLPVATAALGRTLLAASMMGDMLKEDNGALTLQIKGGGPLGTILAVSDCGGNVRGYVQDPHVELMEKVPGKLDVGAAVGTDGSLTVIKDLGLKEPYIGSIGLFSGEIADDIAMYFVESEQIPTACALGVLVDRDQSVLAAGGYLIQLLPGADDGVISAIEQGIQTVGPVTEALRSGADVRTSMVNPDDARKAFEPYIAQGDDVVYFSISAGISGSWWSAKLAGDELMEQYPQRRVCPIDSMGASLGAGIPALKASSLVRQGMGLDELVEKMTVYCQNYCQYFAVDDLKYLRKGGRISGASALVGSLLQIKPILRGNEEGKIVLFDKARGKLRAIERLVSIYKERAIDLDDLIGISHGDCPGEALRLETKLREAGHRGPILLVPHEPVTGAHVGPGMLSLYFHAVGK